MIKMQQELEENEVRKEFEKARAEGRQPRCPYCHEPLEIGQFYSVYVQWTWNNKKKCYQKEEPDWDADKPFCDACEFKDWDFADNDLIV
jgi:hypothetical protein